MPSTLSLLSSVSTSMLMMSLSEPVGTRRQPLANAVVVADELADHASRPNAAGSSRWQLDKTLRARRRRETEPAEAALILKSRPTAIVRERLPGDVLAEL